MTARPGGWEEKLQQEFASIHRNTDSFREYQYAATFMHEDETPFAWIRVRHISLKNPHLLVTDKRLILFGNLFGGGPFSKLDMDDELPLGPGLTPLAIAQGQRYVDLEFRDTEKPSHAIVVQKVPADLADQIRKFVAAPEYQRRATAQALHAQPRERATPHFAQPEPAGMVPPAPSPFPSPSRLVAPDLSILSGRTRKLAEENIGGERVLFTLLGAFGQALVALETRVIIVKSGFLAGALGGGRVTSFAYEDITAIEINTGILTGVIEIGTPSYTLSQSRDFWTTHPDKDPAQANNCLPIVKAALWEYQPYIEQLRKLVAEARRRKAGTTAESADLASQLTRLAALRDSGLLTEEEYKRAKEKLLGTG